MLLVWLSLCIPATGWSQIRPYAKNPWYWQYENKPLLLIGGSDQDNIFQWAGDGTKLADHLDLLAASGGNYVRCTMSSRSYAKGGHCWNVYPYPFANTGGKYDLLRWNEAYWSKLRTFLEETKKRTIVVQLEFWDRWNESGDSRQPGNGWYDSPWNPNNNINYDWSDSSLLLRGKTPFYNPFHMAAVVNDPVLLPLQQRFVRKLLDEVINGGFHHVLFQVDNESGIGDASLEPDPYWAAFARRYARSRGRDIYVCTQRRFHSPTPYKTPSFQDWKNPEIRVPITNRAFNYCDISQNNGTVGQRQYDNIFWFRERVSAFGARPINNVKAYLFDWPIGAEFSERTPGGEREATTRLWRAVLAGAASFRFHRRTEFARRGIYPGLGLNDTVQTHLKSMSLLVHATDLFSMTPRPVLLAEREDDEAYCLAEPGKQYAVFFTGNGDRSVRLDLSAANRELELQWLDIANRRWHKTTRIPATGSQLLRPPGKGRWVAVLLPANGRSERLDSLLKETGPCVRTITKR